MLSYGFTLFFPCFFAFLCSSNSCKPNTQVDRNPVFTNALFTMCIPILFRCSSYPCVFRIMQAKWALIELLQLQVGVEGNFVWFVPLLPRRRPPHLSCSIDRSIHQTRHHDPWPSFAASDLLPCWQHPPQWDKPSSTPHMNLRSTRVHKRGHTLLFLLMLCIA